LRKSGKNHREQRELNLASFVDNTKPAQAEEALKKNDDLSARKKAEEALRQSNETFRIAFENAPTGMGIVAPNGQYLAVNPQLCEMIGYSEADLLSGTLYNITHPDDIERSNKWLKKVMAGDQSEPECEKRYLHKDGHVVWGVVRARWVRNPDGSPRFSLAHIQDITERKRAEASLIASEQKYRELANTVPIGIFEFDVGGKLTFVNKILFEWFGYSEDEFKAGISLIDLATPEDRQRLKENIAKAAALQSSAPREYSLVRKSGETIQVLALTKPIMEQEQLQGFRGILLDLTDKKKTELALQNAAKLDSLGVLAGGIAHDFNNLLTGIFGHIDLARCVAKEPQVKKYLEATMASMNRAKALTLQLLTFAKGGSPVLKLTPIISFIEETAQFALSGSNSVCQFSLADDLWPCNIDKNQIGQVIDNIVINAQQAMASGGTIEISAENTSFEENEHPPLSKGDYVKVSIKDFGVGIPKDIMPRIFDPFYTTKIKGHGLGLTTSYSIILRHGGCIDAESEQGKGSTFHVYLPASNAPVAANIAVDCRHQGSGTIIVADDEDGVRNAFRCMLESLGYTAVCKNDGKEAIDFYINETRAMRQCAALIFDLTIAGGMGGVEAAREIRKLNEEIPVFVTSGYADNSVLKNPNAFGFTASIFKPFTILELSKILNAFIKPRK
jgi:PAS domain S-box-containing protein